MGVPRYMVALSLQLVLAQRLVRVICENCAEPHSPAPHEHEWLRYELAGLGGLGGGGSLVMRLKCFSFRPAAVASAGC